MKNNLIKILLTMSFLILTITASIIGYFERNKLDALEDNFKLKGESTITLEYKSKYYEPGYSIEIDGKNYSKDVEVLSNIDESKIGEYEVKYTIKYKNYKKTLTRKVKIIDTVSPELTLGDKEIYCTVNDKCDDITYKAVDNYDGDITSKVTKTSNVDIKKKGTYGIVFSVEDSSGNKTEQILKVNVTDKFEHTYVEVKISTQKLVYYVKKKPVLATDVVTGQNGATKTGNFKILRKTKDQWLVTKTYRSKVKFWMAYDGISYGLHDAGWRKKFGGNIYKTNGSHGCVNLPTSVAEKLYSMIEVGTPVYIRR